MKREGVPPTLDQATIDRMCREFDRGVLSGEPGVVSAFTATDEAGNSVQVVAHSSPDGDRVIPRDQMTADIN